MRAGPYKWRPHGVWVLASYRVYYVEPSGRLELGQTMSCADDAQAVERVRAAGDGRACELWEGGRLIGRFSKLGLFTPAES